jgi:sugar phosphate isomerase/epimerase
MSKYPPGLALHTLRNELHQDFIGTLRKVASIGYKLIEPTNYGGLTADEFVKVLKCLGLGVVSTRILPNLDELAFQLDYAKKIGAKYFYTIFVDKENFKDEASIQEVIRKLKIMGMEAKRRGIQLLYHPRDNEYGIVGGKRIVDRIIEGVGTDLLKLLIDIYWAKKGGVDPLQTLYKYKGLVPIIHVKDIDKAGGFTNVGSGIIDWPSIFCALKDVGVQYYFVEQDDSPDHFKSIKTSLDYLRSIDVA